MKTTTTGGSSATPNFPEAAISIVDANKITSINLCARNIINQMDYIVELANTNIDKNLKYSLVEEVVESMKKSCDSILKCLDVELKKGE